jgi:hypothetical protein
LYGAFVWARRPLKYQKRRFAARAVTITPESVTASLATLLSLVVDYAKLVTREGAGPPLPRQVRRLARTYL